MEGKHLYLKPEEAKFLSMAVVAMSEHLKETSTNALIPWSPEVRKDLKDMLDAGNALKIKLVNLGFNMNPLPKYVEGELIILPNHHDRRKTIYRRIF